MGIKLIIINTESDAAPKEEIFHDDHIKIGRNSQNTLYIDSPHISRFHAEIIFKETGNYQLICFKSNTTKVDDYILEAKRPFNLKDNDNILLPGYTIKVKFLDDTKAKQNISRANTATIMFPVTQRDKEDIRRKSKKLAYTLRQFYADLIYENRDERRKVFKHYVDKICEAIPLKDERKDIILSTSNILQSGKIENTFTSMTETLRVKASYETIKTMAKSINNNFPLPTQDIEIKNFGKHWSKTLKLLLDALYDRILFHKDLLREFDNSTNHSLDCSNPLQNEISSKQLADYLLNWKKEDIVTVSKNLQELLDKMKIQQKTLSINIQKKYHKILSELSPSVLEKEVDSKVSNKLIERMLFTKQQKLWDQFVEKHKELSENMEKNTF